MEIQSLLEEIRKVLDEGRTVTIVRTQIPGKTNYTILVDERKVFSRDFYPSKDVDEAFSEVKLQLYKMLHDQALQLLDHVDTCYDMDGNVLLVTESGRVYRVVFRKCTESYDHEKRQTVTTYIFHKPIIQ